MRVLSKIPPPFPEEQGSLCIHSFFSFLEAPGQEENDAISTFLLHNRWMAGVNDPGDSLQPEISQNQTCLAHIWKMRIVTFYLENFIDPFSATSNEERENGVQWRLLPCLKTDFLLK